MRPGSEHLSPSQHDSRRHNDDLDEADEEKDEGGAGHVRTEPGVHLSGVLETGKNKLDVRQQTELDSDLEGKKF